MNKTHVRIGQYVVTLFREYSICIMFHAYKIVCEGKDGTLVFDKTGDFDQPEYVDTNGIPTDECKVFVQGNVRNNGCMEMEFVETDIHTCDREGVEGIGQLLLGIRDNAIMLFGPDLED